jgi:hypothetical protein
MPVCIFCRSATTGTEPLEHPALQALGTSKYPLPRGAACGGCNHYLKDLDQHVCNHHHLASLISIGGILGQKGRLRSEVSPRVIFDHSTQSISFRIGSNTAVSFSDGHLNVAEPGYTKFDEWKFSRGLHRIALGVLAYCYDADVALRSCFDPVRDYIRKPPYGRDDHKLFYQRIVATTHTARTLRESIASGAFYFAFHLDQSRTLAYMNLLVDEFVVALSGQLQDASDNAADALAAHSDAPWRQRSRRRWVLLPVSKIGR